MNSESIKKAVAHLKEIWEYTCVNWPEKQTDKYYNEIIERSNELLIDSLTGKNYDNIIKELKGVSSNKHIIFY
ncbi:MAG: type II toxin-antitoxin system RelE/ParE family toxin [Saprospiraceae bacterium]|nr:type II toxin-antitoxin system RelE/ParE family toxin [Candidatus Defluviibacterium haderslevense]